MKTERKLNAEERKLIADAVRLMMDEGGFTMDAAFGAVDMLIEELDGDYDRVFAMLKTIQKDVWTPLH